VGTPPATEPLAQETGEAWWRHSIRGPAGVDGHLGVRRATSAPTIDEQTAIQQALSALSVDAAHREAVRQAHRRFAAELFDLAREAETEGPAIARRLRGLGLEPDGGLVAVACDPPDADAWLARFELALEAAGLRAVATSRGDRLLAVAEWPEGADADALCARLAGELGDAAPLGVGSPVADPARLDVAISDARRACRLARARQDDRRAATARELTSHAGLLAQQDPDVLEHFWRELLGPLLEHDAARGSQLLATLEAFLRAGGRWAPVARELHVHVNTLRHRLARVEALTGRRLDDPDDRVDLHLAVRARRRANRPNG
jgi:hypothetical protein